jgi:hypothetical protein
MSTLEEYKKRREELHSLIENEKKTHLESMYKYVTELYELEVQHNPKYIAVQLCIDLDLEKNYVCRLLRYKNSPQELKDKVASGEISLYKAMRLMRSGGKNKVKLLEKAQYIIDNKLTHNEIDKFVKKENIETDKLMKEREYKSTSNVYRDIMVHINRLLGVLKSFDKVPKNRKVEVKRKLRLLGERIKVVLTK